MKIDVRASNLNLTADHRQQAERRILFALGRFSSLITRVTVSLADVNGPREGNDKACRIVVRMRSGGEVVADAIDADTEIVVNMAADRVYQSVRRVLERRRERKFAYRGKGW